MQTTLALVIPATALFIYVVLASIEFGASLFVLFPSVLAHRNAVKDYMNPLWETTSIFLAFALISILTCFPGATIQWTSDLFPILFSFLAVMGVRIACILLTQYGDSTSVLVRAAYFLSCFTASLVGFLMLIYFLGGTWHLPGNLFLSAALLALGTIVFAASSFFRAYRKSPKLTGLTRFFGTIFFAAATWFFVALTNAYPYLVSSPRLATDIPLALMLCTITALLGELEHSYRLVFVSMLAATATLFFGFFAGHLPYVIYPSVTIAASMTNAASFSLFETSFGIGIVLVIPALVLLYKLFLVEKKTK